MLFEPQNRTPLPSCSTLRNFFTPQQNVRILTLFVYTCYSLLLLGGRSLDLEACGDCLKSFDNLISVSHMQVFMSSEIFLTLNRRVPMLYLHTFLVEFAPVRSTKFAQVFMIKVKWRSFIFGLKGNCSSNPKIKFRAVYPQIFRQKQRSFVIAFFVCLKKYETTLKL